MRYRRLGNSGLKVSEIAIGGWFKEGEEIGERTLTDRVAEAFERGVNYIDLADIYGRGSVESLYGSLLKGYPREQLVISTKCYWPMSQGINDRGLSRKHLFESLHSSLRRLETDYVDLFMCHADDHETPLEETIRAMSDLIRQGKTMYWGLCGWSAERIFELHQVCEHLNAPKPIVHHIAYNLLERYAEREQLSLCSRLGLGITAWSPFAGGVLAHGNIVSNQGASELGEKTRIIESALLEARHDLPILLKKLKESARESSLTMAQLSLAWVLRRPEVSSIVLSVSSQDQLIENLNLFQRDVDYSTLNELSQLF